MARLYKRTAKLALWRPVAFFSDGSNAIEIESLRAVFQIEKTLQKEPNTATIQVFNLSTESRALLQTKPVGIRLEAGYDGQTETIFQGDVRHATSRREGTEWITKILSGEGDRSFNHAITNRSYRAGTSYRTMLGDVASDMGLRIPRNIAEASDFLQSPANGETFFGSSAKAMDRITKRTGRSWSVQGQALQVVGELETIGRVQFTMSQANGMVGSPEYGTPGNKGERPTLAIRSLLYPSIVPGARLHVDSEEIKGDFRIQKVTHEGDTHGGDWITNTEAVHL